MYFRQIIHEEKSCLSYLIGCTEYGVAAVVDAQGDPAVYRDLAARNGMNIAAVFETHTQADHYAATQELARLTGAPVYLGPGAQARFAHETLADGQEIKIGNRRFKVFHTPGHTPEHVCVLVNDWFLLTGDTLFAGDVGRIDLPSEAAGEDYRRTNAAKLYDSTQRLLALPEWTEIYPAHYGGSVCGRGIDGKPSSTIGRERRKNEALQLARDDFVAFQLSNPPALPEGFLAIVSANRGETVLPEPPRGT